MLSLKGCLIDHLYIITTFFFFWVLPVVTRRDLFGSKRGERRYEEQPNKQKSWERPKLLLFCLDQAFFSLTAISCLVVEINEFIPTQLNLVGAWHQGPCREVPSRISHQASCFCFFFRGLTEKTNPSLENENCFITDWVESKWPDLQSPLWFERLYIYDNLLTCQLSYFHLRVAGWVLLLYNRLKWEFSPGSAAKVCIAATCLVSHLAELKDQIIYSRLLVLIFKGF